ncbi:MAG: hypothetical protein RR585_15505 [Coprobacillus sp.]
MYYCDKCHMIFNENHCLNCGQINLREVHDKDYCFLIEKEMMWCEMFKEVLDNYDIPYICESSMGAAMGLKMGVAIEKYQIFTPYPYYQRAMQIVKHMFGDESNNSIMK